jgi:acyl-CoA synthetase (AMP-forming)/AMP-acid ligase II
MNPPSIRHEVHYGQRLVLAYQERPTSIDALFGAALARDPAALALVDGARRMSYSALGQTVERLAGNLTRLGIVKGDRVASLIGNRCEFVELVLACARLGAIIVPMNVRQKMPESNFALNQSGACVLVHEAALAPELPEREAVPALRHRFSLGGAVAGSQPYAALDEPAAAVKAVSVQEDDAFCLLYTSGTTGRPKGAILTHFSVIHSCLNYRHLLRLDARDRAILAVPASHVTGLVAIILSTIGVGGATVLMPAFKARAFLELAARERMTFSLMVPAIYNLCLLEPDFAAFDLASWRVGGYGGAPMPQATIARLSECLPGLTLVNAYGATETTSPATLMPLGEGLSRADSVGKAVPGCDLKVMDEAGREVAPGEPGELWIAGPMVVPGYWRNPEADAERFIQGYWRSGDIGSVDAQGYVRVFDRRKDMINRGGYKIYSAEVENVLNHHPAVIESAVIGRPDPVLGERVQAFIVARRDNVGELELMAFCAQRLSDYKIPERFVLLGQPLPRNANGKVLKHVLRQMIEAETSVYSDPAV